MFRASSPSSSTNSFVLSTLAKLEELYTKSAMRFDGVKVCKDKVIEPLAMLKDLKVVNIKANVGGKYTTHPMTVIARPKEVAQPGSEGSVA